LTVRRLDSLITNGLTDKPSNRQTFISPTGLRHAGDFSIQREATETETAHAKAAVVRALTAALHAAIVFARREFRRPLLFFTQSFSCHNGFLL